MCAQLSGGLTCVLDNAVTGGGSNCILQLCHGPANKDVLALFMLGLALCLVAVMGLTHVPTRLTRAARHARQGCATVCISHLNVIQLERSLWMPDAPAGWHQPLGAQCQLVNLKRQLLSM